MFSTTFLIGFYSVCAVVLALAVWRIIRRNRAERAAAESDVSIEEAPLVESSQTARTPSDVTWSEQRLLADPPGDRHESSSIPPDEIPSVDAGDLLFGPATKVLAAFLPESAERKAAVVRDLHHAGYYGPHAWHNLAAIRYLLIVPPLLAFGSLLVLVPPAYEPPIVGLLVLAPLMGWALPRLYVRNVAAERLSQIERAVPDMLDMLNMCVSQGLTVHEAMRWINRELRGAFPALAKELRIVAEQAEIGTLRQALENFSARAAVPEVQAFTALVIQTERMGTSISAALTEHSDTMRENLRQRADEKANRAAFKLLFPTVLCLMPAVYLFLLGPAVIELSNFFTAGGGSDTLDATQQLQQTL